MLIGKLIPAGTGMKRYRSVKLDTDFAMEDEIVLGEDEDEILLSDNEDEMMEEAPEVFDIDEGEELDFVNALSASLQDDETLEEFEDEESDGSELLGDE